jgi:low affinity Fe/Cu permease
MSWARVVLSNQHERSGDSVKTPQRLQIDLRGRRSEPSDPGVHDRKPPRRANVAQSEPKARATSSPSHDFFRRFAHRTSSGVGSPWAFAAAFLTVIVWGITGPVFGFSDTWQLVINTGTTIVTFLMVFLIQNTQNRDAIAIHLKLDELIRAVKGARNQLVDLEELSDEELEALQREFRRLSAGRLDAHPHVTERGS